MSCCGQKRAQLQLRTDNDRREQGDSTPVYFQYIGTKQLLVIGRETNKRYWFDKPGMILEVDQKDWRSLKAVPVLRRVQKQDG
jgi:hypothetical protein